MEKRSASVRGAEPQLLLRATLSSLDGGLGQQQTFRGASVELFLAEAGGRIGEAVKDACVCSMQ